INNSQVTLEVQGEGINKMSTVPFHFKHIVARCHLSQIISVVEIMIGVFTIASGIAVSQGESTFLYSGIAFWGSLIYISAGSLTVLAENKLHPCVVKGSLVMNVFSAVAAGIAIIVMVVDIAIANPCYRYYYYSRPNEDLCVSCLTNLSVLEFIISICTSAFACKATCCNDPVSDRISSYIL
uniref:Membrane-spanning 4-domains subfamily A member 4A-like n=1 Tax=Astyanax mexicanus TaxID=7994 RepID=A0A8B9L3T2_ASTMX